MDTKCLLKRNSAMNAYVVFIASFTQTYANRDIVNFLLNRLRNASNWIADTCAVIQLFSGGKCGIDCDANCKSNAI